MPNNLFESSIYFPDANADQCSLPSELKGMSFFRRLQKASYEIDCQMKLSLFQLHEGEGGREKLWVVICGIKSALNQVMFRIDYRGVRL